MRTSAEPHRVWRLRRQRRSVDLYLTDEAGSSVELRLMLNNATVYARECRTREKAMADARAMRLRLEQSGWTPHW